MSASEHASLPGGENLGSGQNISQGCCPSRLGNGATGSKSRCWEGRGGWRREVRLIRATLPKGYGESGPQADDRLGCEARSCFEVPRHHLKLVAHVYSIAGPT